MPRTEVSVVVPTRNRVALLAQTLHTVLQQSVELEVIVVDEASSDATPSWLDAHADPRVRTIRHDRPKGLSEARNAGIDAARGRWVAFVDDDDLWLPTKLADQIAAADAQDAPWAYGGELVFTAEPRLLAVNRAQAEDALRLPWDNVVPGGGSNAIASLASIEQVGGFATDIDIVADWDLWIRLLQVGDPAVLPEPVMAYRIHASNMSKDLGDMLRGFRSIEQRYHHLRSGEPIDWYGTYRWFAQQAWEVGDRNQARHFAWLAFRDQPKDAFRLVARTFVPIARRPPVAEAREADGLLDRISPRAVVPWPEGTDRWLREVLAVRP